MFRRPGQLHRLKGWEDQAPMGPVVCPECGSWYVEEMLIAFRRLPDFAGEISRVTTDDLAVLWRCGTCGWTGNRPHSPM